MRFFLLLVSLCALSLQLSAQQVEERAGNESDSLVRLISAKSAIIEEIDGVSYRKIVGPARFLHNNTFLDCDTAKWNVRENIIYAYSNVKISQGTTTLTSDKIEYVVAENLAKFRGNLVELSDKDGNILRTNFLDYNTLDSIAFFYNGGSMRGKDGNLIESINGNYVAANKIFSFVDNVEMFTDSTFVKSDLMSYDTQLNRAIFYENTIAWNKANKLFTNSGYFDREANRFTFNKDSYILTTEQELWADSLIYNRNSGIAEAFDNIQMLDTVQKALVFGDYAKYEPEKTRIRISGRPSVALYNEENGVKDTLYLSADTIKYYTERFCDIDSTLIAQAKERKSLAMLNPVEELEKIATDKIARAKNRTNMVGVSADELNGTVATDTISIARDTINFAMDTANVAMDSVETPAAIDTTSVQFINAWRNVKIYKKDVQACCDTLIYTGIDSIARLYNRPILWNDIKHQLTADSMQIVFKNSALYKSNMITNAFIASQEDTSHFNQVKGLEMMAFFKDNDIYRFDALGGSSMLFFIREDSLITMMNQKECKIISAHIKEREIERIKYFDSIENDVKPTYNLTYDDMHLRGFEWRGEERPKEQREVCDREVKKSERRRIDKVRLPTFPISKTYFPQERSAIVKR